MGSVRMTVMLDDEVLRKIRIKQAQQIQKTKAACSLSAVLNQCLNQGLKNAKATHARS